MQIFCRIYSFESNQFTMKFKFAFKKGVGGKKEQLKSLTWEFEVTLKLHSRR